MKWRRRALQLQARVCRVAQRLAGTLSPAPTTHVSPVSSVSRWLTEGSAVGDVLQDTQGTDSPAEVLSVHPSVAKIPFVFCGASSSTHLLSKESMVKIQPGRDM